MGRLQELYYERPEDLAKDSGPEGGLEDAPFTEDIRNTLVKEVPVSLRISVWLSFADQR